MLYSFIFFVGVLEILVRIFFFQITTESERDNLNHFISLTAQNKVRFEERPYEAYVNTPFFKDEYGVQHNSIGLKQQNEVNTKKNKYRILCLGESTTYGRVLKYTDAWPIKVEDILTKKYNVEVLNGGISGGTSAEILTHFIFNYQNLNPDLVIIHGKVNDIRPSIFSNYKEDYSHWRKYKTGSTKFLSAFEVFLISKIKIFEFTYLNLYKNIPPLSNNNLYIYNFEEIKQISENEFKTTGFENNLENLFILLAKNINTIYFQVPINKDKENRQKIVPYIENEKIFILYNKNMKIAKGLCEKYNIPYIKMNNELLKDNYTDICHLNEKGHFIKGNFISEYLICNSNLKLENHEN